MGNLAKGLSPKNDEPVWIEAYSASKSTQGDDADTDADAESTSSTSAPLNTNANANLNTTSPQTPQKEQQQIPDNEQSASTSTTATITSTEQIKIDTKSQSQSASSSDCIVGLEKCAIQSNDSVADTTTPKSKMRVQMQSAADTPGSTRSNSSYGSKSRSGSSSVSGKLFKLPEKVKNMLVGTDASMIGKYEVLEELGRGAQGVVHKCLDTESVSYVAIKTMTNQGLGRHWNRRDPAVTREVAMLKKIKHPNLVSLIEVMTDEESKCSHVVLEYVDGGPLPELSDKSLMKGLGTPLREDESRSYFRQLLAALSYLHFHKILHRDIKPANLLIDRNSGILKVTDFGIAINSNEEKAARILGNDDNILAYANVAGTPAFLPPEYYKLLRGDADDSLDEVLSPNSKSKRNKLKEKLGFSSSRSEEETVQAAPETGEVEEVVEEEWKAPQLQYFNGRPADIWASGVTLYAFTYGKLPFTPPSKSRTRRASTSGNVVTLQDQIVDSPLKFPGTGFGVSGKLRNLLSRMLEKNPLKRIQMHELLLDPWVCLIEPMPSLSGEQKSSLEPNANEIKALTHIARITRKARSEAHRISSKARISVSSHLSAATRSASRESYDSDDDM